MNYLRRIAIRAIEEKNYSPEAIADILGISRRSIYDWLRGYRDGGENALETQLSPGAKPVITEEMDRWLKGVVLTTTPMDHGYDTRLWNRELLAEGTTVTLPDTEENQDAYPQPASQRKGLGFPSMRRVGLLCIASGALLDAASGPCEGKGSDEQTLFRGLLDQLEPGDILLGDAYFPTDFLLCELWRRGVDGLFAQYGARRRSTDFSLGERLGTRDPLIVWTKPKRPPWMSEEAYARVPEPLTVRELYAGGKLLVTTFLCPKHTPQVSIPIENSPKEPTENSPPGEQNGLTINRRPPVRFYEAGRVCVWVPVPGLRYSL
jgi:hypothetical protein